jgi:3D (Asp-Asp-Asp) domain-containing protein
MIGGVFFYAQPKVEAVTVLAKDSQENIQELNNQELNNTEISLNTDDKKIESFEINLEAEAAAGSGNKARAFKATAYCLRGKTASGRMVRRGIVAADPRVLPLGTRIRLSGGKYSGNYVVADTGGRIKGRILDIWVPSCAEARRWGRRTVKVAVVGKAKKKSKKRRRR